MSEVAPQAITPEERISRMRDVLGHALDSDLSNVEVLGAFIDLYEEHSVSEEDRIAFYEELDFPEHRVIFGDDTFDLIVERYDELGGVPRYELFPDTQAESEPEPVPSHVKSAADRHRGLNEHLTLPDGADQPTSIRLPKAVHAKLRQLVDGVKSEGMNASQRDVISTLIAFNNLKEAELAALVRRYRRTTVGEFLDDNPDLAE